MLLISTAGLDFINLKDEKCSAFDCVSRCINRFPYANDTERGMVSVTLQKDFAISAPSLIVVHVLFNLLKNAIHHSYESQSREVTISIGDELSSKVIKVCDNGNGIPTQIRNKIFERFFTTQAPGEGAGLGLSFCYTAMKKMGGTITCISDSKSYSIFSLEFP